MLILKTAGIFFTGCLLLCKLYLWYNTLREIAGLAFPLHKSGGGTMTVFEALSFAVMFATLVVLILSFRKKPRNQCGNTAFRQFLIEVGRAGVPIPAISLFLLYIIAFKTANFIAAHFYLC